MNIIVKTVANKKFPLVDVASDSTVADLRERIATELDLGGEIKKLIFKGKSLKDGATLESCGLECDSEIVCLVKKARGGKKAKKATTPAKADAKTTPEAREYTVQAEDVRELMGMGFPQHMVVISLKAAFGDPKVAAQYLIAGGIPANRAAALQKEFEEQQAKAGASAPAAPAPAQQASAAGPQGMNARFEAMLANPGSMQAILGNKQVQQQCLQMLAQENPALFQQFLADPDKVGETEAFQRAMFNILRKSFSAGPARPNVIQLSEEDRTNIQQLQQSKQLSRQQAVQIYLNNGKDLARCDAFCDQMMEQAIARAQTSGRLSAEQNAEIQRLKAQAAHRGTNVLSASIEQEQQASDEHAPQPPTNLNQRRALSPRNSNIQTANSPKPEKASSPTAANAGDDAVLSIPLDMLMDDEE